jgi:thioredoxin-like negative regulator of GroEL
MVIRRQENPIALVLYTREGCHLCEEMQREIERARLGSACALREVDIDSDPALAERYGRSIPVLEIEGRPAFKGRLTAEELRRKVDRALRASETA